MKIANLTIKGFDNRPAFERKKIYLIITMDSPEAADPDPSTNQQQFFGHPPFSLVPFKIENLTYDAYLAKIHKLRIEKATVLVAASQGIPLPNNF